ncbi:MAG: acylphosphatase [Jatrophihabitans sp.]|nr:acylphosphatase [Jatrophihabitans sp.]
MADSADARLTALVSGDVQGVGFRDWVRRQAARHGLAGAATNRPDGRVEVVAEGPREAVSALLAALRSAAAPGNVQDVAESWEAPRGEPSGFRMH